MTVTEHTDQRSFVPVAFDLYRDIHKGIRAELFDVTGAAGRLDPGDHSGRAALAAQVGDVVGRLVDHAEHEDGVIQPVLETELPALAVQVATEHRSLDARMEELRAWAVEAVDAAASEERFAVHRLYVELASFTAAYLLHQDVEERMIMPALEAAVGVERVVGMHEAILASIPPDEMAKSLAVMLPSMNVDDRFELLAGARAGMPAEVFEQVWSLTRSVLRAPDCAAVGTRLGID